MWFHETLKEAWEAGIYPAVKHDCKMEPVRIDLVPHNDNIVDKIIAEIRTCQFMVADFTGHRGGVYFEAGFAKGLGREVIWTCREDDFKNIHFDIAQFSHIVWKDPADLRTRLADRIKATILGAV
jgi:nucleoside 2-deoxyribosyltransferase